MSGVSLLLVTCLAASACSTANDPQETGATGNAEASDGTSEPATDGLRTSITLGVGEDIVDLDPHTALSRGDRSALRFAYDTLLSVTPDGQLVPHLAESWESRGDSVTLTLRDDIMCADGTPLTVGTVAANFERLKDPDTGAPFAAAFLGSTDFEVSVDESSNSVTLDLPAPFGVLPNMLAHYPGIVCQAGLDDPEALESTTFGTGPFVLADLQPGQSARFVARDGYSWGPDGMSTDVTGFPEEVVLQIVSNETTAANLLLAGDLDLAVLTEIEAGRVAADAAGEHLSAVEVPNAIYSLWFNQMTRTENPALEEPVRRALAQVVDRQALSQVASGNPDNVHDSAMALPQSPCSAGVPSGALVAYGSEAAGKTLTDAGWARNGSGPWTKDGRTLALTYLVSGNTGTPARAAGEYIANAWREFGVDVDAQTVDDATGVDIIRSGEWDVFTRGWTNLFHPGLLAPEYANPESSLNIWLGSDDYSNLIDEAYAADPDSECDIYNRAEAVIAEEVSVFPLFYSAPSFFADGVEFQVHFSFIEPASLRVVE